MPDFKRSHSPSAEIVDKRPRHSTTETATSMELDFTGQFTSQLVSEATQPATSTNAPAAIESCGFCDIGSYCVCAEVVTNKSRDQALNRLPPLLHEVTPPPSDHENDHQKITALQPAVIHRALSEQAASATDPCANGPGSCQQCRADPKSAAFCRSMSKLHNSASALPSPSLDATQGCCGNLGAGGCCKAAKSHPAATNPPPSLNIADTYRTLSTHHAFEPASASLSSWVGHLNTTSDNSQPQHAGRAAIEVEAASVMGVLKLFDRRFGRG